MKRTILFFMLLIVLIKCKRWGDWDCYYNDAYGFHKNSDTIYVLWTQCKDLSPSIWNPRRYKIVYRVQINGNDIQDNRAEWASHSKFLCNEWKNCYQDFTSYIKSIIKTYFGHDIPDDEFKFNPPKEIGDIGIDKIEL